VSKRTCTIIPGYLFLEIICFCLTNKDVSLLMRGNTHTHTTILLLFWNMSGTTRVSRYQKGKTRKVKTKLDLLEREIVSGSGIGWAICKSVPHPRQPHQHPTTTAPMRGKLLRNYVWSCMAREEREWVECAKM